MNILHLGSGSLQTPPVGYGGIERYVFESARGLAARGNRVVIFDIRLDRADLVSEQTGGIEIIRLHCLVAHRSSSLWLSNIYSVLNLLGFSLRARRYIKKNSFEVIHIHRTLVGLVLVLVLPSQREKMIYTVHSPVWVMQRGSFKDRLSRKLDIFIMKRVHRVIAQSARIKNILERERAAPGRIRLLPCGVDTSAFNPASRCSFIRRKYGIDDRLLVLFVGRIVPYKGVEYLVRAANLVVNKAGFRKCAFLLAGPMAEHGLDALEHAAYPKKVSSLIAEYNLGDFVFLSGSLPQDDLQMVFASADIFVLPSLAESSPAVVLQALASGCAVVASDISGIHEQVVEGVNGYLVKAGDETELAKRILELLQSPARRSAMGANGRELVKKGFDWGVICGRLEGIYREAT
ncbi:MULTISPECIES: glycosyltransferase family 4 protein [Dehalococcoides]|jgi:glycosyltransferase involved in cell wall biosynthesis|uniref:glycosyltransferase family 4 protein n=1 Tax=Dehalococcoides TaxID=61434 RepID=UPI0002B76146|nr:MULTISPECIES: glycosyltransferase family 4 protein [Dehalococcoides]AGG05845.1 glycosyltransferase, family 1 [Dehalococcoides mccartyi DCMB5]BAS31329.1 glycosyltransferase, family 1 [Dehalococcoides mccartyi IBARAKI]BEL00318.1 glycosyltransferase family 1 protein [Dehalococcoides mccartyi]